MAGLCYRRNTACAVRRGKVEVRAVRAGYTSENIALAAQETAERVVAALGGGGLAAGFVRDYTEKNHRRALVAHPARHRELIERIGREALLAMVARLERDLARRLGAALPRGTPRRALRKNGEDASLANHFRVEFYGRLAERLDWGREELEDFWRDLDLYTGAARVPRPGKKPRGRRPQKRDRHLGAFADRCAFLLDSSLLERARRAAARLHRELERAALRAARAGFRSAGIDRIASRVKPRLALEPRRINRKKIRRNKRVAVRMKKRGGRR